MADEDFIINIQPTPNFIVELNEQGPQGPRGPQGVQGDKGDVGPAGTMPVGTIFPHTCSSTFVPENSLPCNGTEYSQTQFPALWTDWLVGGRLNTCTYSQYQSGIDTYGKCGKWALDTENGKFKTPYIPDGTHIQQAMTDGELGKSYNAGLPNIVGNLTTNGNSFTTISGAFATRSQISNLSGGHSAATGYGNLTFDASHSNPIYGNSDTAQTEAVSLRYFVVVATGSINQSEMDWSQWTSSLQSKATIDMDNLSTAGKAKVAGLAMPSNKYIDLTLGASGSQYTAPANGWVCFSYTTKTADRYIALENLSGKWGITSWCPVGYDNGLGVALPVLKQDIFRTNYTVDGSVKSLKFYYAQGEVLS